MGFLDRALSRFAGGDGGNSGSRCSECQGPLRLEDPSDGMYVCDACTGAVHYEQPDGSIVDAQTHRSRIYEERKAAGEFDGPFIHRVTWMKTDGSGEIVTEEYTVLDHGWDHYQHRLRDPYCRDVTWMPNLRP